MSDIWNPSVRFVEEHLEEWHADGQVSRAGWQAFGQAGLLGISATGGPLARLREVVHELSAFRDPGLVSTYAINEISLNLAFTFADALPETVREDLLRGRANVALSMSEVEAGSNVAGISARAVREGDAFRLSGSKAYISNGPIADYLIVALRTSDSAVPALGLSLFLVKQSDPGVVVERTRTSGIDIMPVGNLHLNDVVVPEDRLLGRENRGFAYLMDVLGYERLVVAILATALARELLHAGARHARERAVFGVNLADYQNTKLTFARHGAQLTAVTSMVDAAVSAADQGKGIDKDVAIMAKVLSTELLGSLAITLGQLYGARGYLEEHWAANLFNDVRWTRIAGGSNEVLLDSLGHHLLRQYGA